MKKYEKDLQISILMWHNGQITLVPPLSNKKGAKGREFK